MKILMLGGTSFVGRAIVEDAVAAGHEVTVFSRGKTGADLFPDLDKRIGDRATGDYTSLEGGTWDATVDVSGYIPRHVAQAAKALGDGAGRYLFISTGSVYDKEAAGDQMTEQTPRLPAERGTEEITGETYGPLKVACEDDVLSTYGDKATIVRPGIVAGPYDPTERFTYWVRRAARGGQVALPGRPEQPVQVVDSRDLARLVVQLLDDDKAGIYNAVGPGRPTTMEALIKACAQGAGTEVEVVPVAPDAVEGGLPLLLPPDYDVMFLRAREAADAARMPATPLEKTAADVLAWDRERGEPQLPQDLTPEREAELIAAAKG